MIRHSYQSSVNDSEINPAGTMKNHGIFQSACAKENILIGHLPNTSSSYKTALDLYSGLLTQDETVTSCLVMVEKTTSHFS